MNPEFLISNVEDLESVIGVADDFAKSKLIKKLDDPMVEFISKSPLVFISTITSSGSVDISPKGDFNGFVSMLDEQTLLIPDRPGNKLAYGFRNILENSQVGLLFVIPGVRETLRIRGSAQITRDPEILASLSVDGKPAILCTVVTVEECLFHCGKAMIRSKVWKSDSWNCQDTKFLVRQFVRTLGIESEVEVFVEQAIEENYTNELY